jgi:hypothetical protein
VAPRGEDLLSQPEALSQLDQLLGGAAAGRCCGPLLAPLAASCAFTLLCWSITRASSGGAAVDAGAATQLAARRDALLRDACANFDALHDDAARDRLFKVPPALRLAAQRLSRQAAAPPPSCLSARLSAPPCFSRSHRWTPRNLHCAAVLGKTEAPMVVARWGRQHRIGCATNGCVGCAGWSSATCRAGTCCRAFLHLRQCTCNTSMHTHVRTCVCSCWLYKEQHMGLRVAGAEGLPSWLHQDTSGWISVGRYI